MKNVLQTNYIRPACTGKSNPNFYALLDPPMMLQSNAEPSSNANADMPMMYCIPSDAYADAGVNAEMRCLCTLGG